QPFSRGSQNRGGDAHDARFCETRLNLPHTVCRMWQFLYFFPEPHGHGSLRPTRGPLWRIGSVFFTSPVLSRSRPALSLFFACDCIVGADSCVAAPIIQMVSAKASLSSMRKTSSVTLSSTPSHIRRNSFMPSCL